MRQILIMLLLLITQQAGAFTYPYLPSDCSINSLPEAILNVEYSNRYSLIVNPKYANILSPYDALALEIAFGASEFRLGATFAHAFGMHHRLKASAEYLSQDHSFQFITGRATEWTEQSSLGVLYQYLVESRFVNAIKLSAYHSHARDEDLPALELPFDQNNNDFRSIIGSNTNGVLAGVCFTPFACTFIDVQLAYDDLRYSSHSENNQSGLGEIISLQQVICKNLGLQLSATHRVLFDEYQAALNWVLYAKHHTALELSFTGKYVDGDNIPEPQETRVGVVLSYRWDASCPPSACCNSCCDQLTKALQHWSLQPVVRMPRTFVLQDERVS